MITSFSFYNKFRILTNLYHESLFICPFFDTNNFSQLQFKLSIFTREHFSWKEILFFSFFFFVFHHNNFFELRWDYTSNVVSLQCRFWSVFLQFRISRTKWRWHDLTFSFSVSSRLSMSASSSHIGSTS